MHAVLIPIKTELTAVMSLVKSSLPNNEPLGNAHSNWSCPGITRDELAGVASALLDIINSYDDSVAIINEPLLSDYARRLNFLRSSTIPNIWGGNGNAAVSAYLMTLDGLKRALLSSIDQKDAKALEVERGEAVKKFRSIQTSLRTLETQIAGVSSRSGNLDEKVAQIEQVHAAADQFPTDLETLKESRSSLEGILRESKTDRKKIEELISEITDIRKGLSDSDSKAAAIVERCDEAYRAATSKGLASAFAERSKALSNSMWVWVVGLVLALSLGAYFGGRQLEKLTNSIQNSSVAVHNSIEIWINVILAIFSVAAPVWFAWVSTKQIGQRFRLSEDYGYKASISKAYEGYRREAELLDEDFRARLFSS
ncbi:MAG: hypothetical protein ACXWJZ_11670, partial [Burkholderiaceae bacterium]